MALLTLLLAFGAGAAGCAQGSRWESLADEAESLYQQGHYDRAMVVAKEALDVAEKVVGLNHPDVAARHQLVQYSLQLPLLLRLMNGEIAI